MSDELYDAVEGYTQVHEPVRFTNVEFHSRPPAMPRQNNYRLEVSSRNIADNWARERGQEESSPVKSQERNVKHDSSQNTRRPFTLTVVILTGLILSSLAVSVYCAISISKLNREITMQNKSFTIADSVLSRRVQQTLFANTQALRTWFASSCTDVDRRFAKVRNKTGGIFRLFRLGKDRIEVYCDTEIDGGGWTVFQRRMDGSVDFYRNWTEYVNGFGDMQREFWLGLENIHKMTSDGVYELRVDMIERNGTYLYAKYDSFRVESNSDNYRLRVGGYSGNASDSMKAHNTWGFSTYDKDNDYSDSNCAKLWKGAWWHTKCYNSHLNGEYTGYGGTAMQWWNVTGKKAQRHRQYTKFSEMKFRMVQMKSPT